MRIRAIVVAAGLLAASGCGTVDTAKLPQMGVDFAFEPRHKCQGGVSPEIRLSDVPAGAARYEVTMTDLDVPTFQHWHQTLPASGARIPEGAGRPYFGPCPPSGTHRYRIDVVARDAGGKPLAAGSRTVEAGR